MVWGIATERTDMNDDPLDKLRRLADPDCKRCNGDGWCETVDPDSGDVLATYECPCVTWDDGNRLLGDPFDMLGQELP